MNPPFLIFRAIALTLFCGITMLAQGDAKHFTKDGLVFNYPSGWTLQDSSSPDAQKLTLVRNDSDAQIRMFVYRARVDSPEKMAEARHALIDPYVNSTAKTFEQMGARPERTPGSIDIGGVPAEGVKIRAVLDGEPGAAEIYWAQIGQRVVVLTYFGPDKALKQMAPAWDTVRTSFQIEAPKPAAKPSPN